MTFPITVEGQTELISTAADLVVALDVLHGHHDRAVLEQLRPNLPDIIGEPPGLYSVLKVLDPDNQLVLIDALGSGLINAVQTASALRDILINLADEKVEEQLIRGLGPEGLRSLILSPEDLAGVLEWVYGRCDGVLLELLGPWFLQRHFQGGYELGLVLHALDHTRQEELIDMLGWDALLALVHNRRDLVHLLRALPAGTSRRLLASFTQDQLWRLIGDEHGKRFVMRYLDGDEVAHLEELLEVRYAE